MTPDLLAEIGRIGIGLTFILSTALDIKSRSELFSLMKIKHVPLPWLFYVGAIGIKVITGLSLTLNIYSYWGALLLSLYIFIANLIFNNFWAVPVERRNFTKALFLIHLVASFGLLSVSATL